MSLMTFAMAQALKDRRPLAVLAEMDHPSGIGRFWTGIGPLVWNGYTWTGAGKLGGVAPIRHTSDISIQEIVFTMSAVSPDDASRLGSSVRKREAVVLLACFDEAGKVIADPYHLLAAELDTQTLNASEEGVTIAITARSGFYKLDRGLDEVWSSEDQQSNYPGDTGMDLISELQNKNVIWKPS
jgi:hypothetical protein